MMDCYSKNIVAMVIGDKREVQLKSTNREKYGFHKALNGLLERLHVKAIVTGGHLRIAALMSKFLLA